MVEEVSESESAAKSSSLSEAASRGMKSSPALAGSWALGDSAFWARPDVVSMAMLMVLCGVAYEGRVSLIRNEPSKGGLVPVCEWLLRN